MFAIMLFIWTAQAAFFLGLFGLIAFDIYARNHPNKRSALALMAVVIFCDLAVDYLLFLHWFA